VITYDDFARVEMCVGRILDVLDFPRAQKPSYRLVIDFGEPLGKKTSSVQALNYTPAELKGRQVICVVNLPPKNIAGFMSEVLVLGVPQENGALALLVPLRDARMGGRVY